MTSEWLPPKGLAPQSSRPGNKENNRGRGSIFLFFSFFRGNSSISLLKTATPARVYSEARFLFPPPRYSHLATCSRSKLGTRARRYVLATFPSVWPQHKYQKVLSNFGASDCASEVSAETSGISFKNWFQNFLPRALLFPRFQFSRRRKCQTVHDQVIQNAISPIANWSIN